MRPYATSVCKVVSPRHMSPAYAGAIATSVAHLKFSAVFGTMSLNNSNTTRPVLPPPVPYRTTQMIASVYSNKHQKQCTEAMSCQESEDRCALMCHIIPCEKSKKLFVPCEMSKKTLCLPSSFFSSSSSGSGMPAGFTKRGFLFFPNFFFSNGADEIHADKGNGGAEDTFHRRCKQGTLTILYVCVCVDI